MSNQKTYQYAVARAIKDTAFRQALVSDPKGALAREFNVQVDAGVTIRVLEDTATMLTLVLPPQEAAMRELSDADLMAVAGAQGTITKSCTNPAECEVIKTIA